ncbi:MAG: zinc ribbon domain-containing protein [Desulfobulbaceae bacterium]|nr:MAG: zinc ribbon domain-containing protein [Desulfobulbaceae bacterium]
MPVYEYECKSCEMVLEVQQKMSDAPLAECPTCKGPVKKLMSMSSFQLKGGGWYADGYATPGSGKSEKKNDTPPATPPCKTGGGCAECPAAAGK